MVIQKDKPLLLHPNTKQITISFQSNRIKSRVSVQLTRRSCWQTLCEQPMEESLVTTFPYPSSYGDIEFLAWKIKLHPTEAHHMYHIRVSLEEKDQELQSLGRTLLYLHIGQAPTPMTLSHRITLLSY